MASPPSPKVLKMAFAFSAVVGAASGIGYTYLESKTNDAAQACETQMTQGTSCTAEQTKAYAINKVADTSRPLSIGLLCTGLMGIGVTRGRKP